MFDYASLTCLMQECILLEETLVIQFNENQAKLVDMKVQIRLYISSCSKCLNCSMKVFYYFEKKKLFLKNMCLLSYCWDMRLSHPWYWRKLNFHFKNIYRLLLWQPYIEKQIQLVKIQRSTPTIFTPLLLEKTKSF